MDIDAAIQTIDLKRIERHMLETNWLWCNEATNNERRVPTVEEIENFIRIRLADCDKFEGPEYSWRQSGGFTLQRMNGMYEVLFDFRPYTPAIPNTPARDGA